MEISFPISRYIKNNTLVIENLPLLHFAKIKVEEVGAYSIQGSSIPSRIVKE